MSLSSASHGIPPIQRTHSTGFLPAPRQIRFVSTDGQPHSKRRRINAACLTCRKRKTRCSGDRPVCTTCTESGHTCSGYAERTPRKVAEGERGEDDAREEEQEELSSTTPRKHPKNVGGLPRSQPKPERQNPTDGSTGTNVLVDYKVENADIISPASNKTASSLTGSRNSVPYFRYFGPTAIVPGFKQMVVQVKDHRRKQPSTLGETPASGQPLQSNWGGGQGRSPVEIPFYDATNLGTNAPLITHLCETFFTHLGCNYPFLQRKRFLKDLEEKRVDAILVDAVCAVAARFSSDPLLLASNDPSIPLDSDNNVKRAFRGHPFAQRAMSAVIDTFSCPTMAVAQACVLLAYEEFGEDHDSGLWMYLGTAIRMAQDLGIQKLEGLQLEGRIGSTPKTAKHGQEGRAEERRRYEQQQRLSHNFRHQDNTQLDDRRASEQERIDTFWAIFFLDRAVSSGVGRPVTLRDKDIEISFPYRSDEAMINGYPDPFPAMIKIVHMHGRVADVLNTIKEVSQATPDVLTRLASMEKDLTGIYQRLSPKLHFNATNFQHYVKAGHGTNFILLHFWFHTLIVLVHQPTLLHSFEGGIQQLFPDSQELSMSSAKTIADILAFAELIDVKSFIGNPFSCQPVYVAACAFLAEAAFHASQSPSGAPSPTANGHAGHTPEDNFEIVNVRSSSDGKAASARHTLLATAANQNYQRCYRALKVMDSYWAGCRYILTALDQKSKGLKDPLLFTAEDIDGEMPSTEPSFTTPGWRRSSALAASLGTYGNAFRRLRGLGQVDESSGFSAKIDLGQAIGWSLTGTANSPAPSISFLYPNTNGENCPPPSEMQGPHAQLPRVDGPNVPSASPPRVDRRNQSYAGPTATRNKFGALPYDPVSTAEADLLLGLNSPYATPSTTQSVIRLGPGQQGQPSNGFDYNPPQASQQADSVNFQQHFIGSQDQNFNNMFVEAQDVDISGQQLNFNFPGGDMIPWLEYLPQDVLHYFGDPQAGDGALMPPGPSPSG
ncbi:hypothetical protein A1O1_06994 [Capronia coronata CBS 617.96]|uniref:Zn(2)-C6 fungal-type domain-containing protein n=1 Tax=Capronia coronata CBS 617.96 TaxID=1182541 RepID=W9XS67_9EURO|nr:uncharacterized protein A1O1_06994 [Capronia coronata CBS 617.96]EXJ83372.1 hypothetical protein A1O1_06994 [Capronia coronata CBS 617.96]